MPDRDSARVARLRPLRVLLAGSDRRFLRVYEALLGRGGYAVATCEKSADVVGRAVRHRSDVVVIEAAGSVTAAVRLAGALEALDRPVRTVLVHDDLPAHELPQLPAVVKWDPVDRLMRAIEAAPGTRSGTEAGGRSVVG